MAQKWMAGMKRRMVARGTVGSLRAAAQRRGMLSGKEDMLTGGDLDRLGSIAKKTKNTALARKVNAARNMMSRRGS
jgi:hypothetical protein